MVSVLDGRMVLEVPVRTVSQPAPVPARFLDSLVEWLDLGGVSRSVYGIVSKARFCLYPRKVAGNEDSTAGFLPSWTS